MNLFNGKYGQCCIQEAKSWAQREHHKADEKDLYSGTQSEEGILGRNSVYKNEINRHVYLYGWRVNNNKISHMAITSLWQK